jgi:type VI secretion system secreted protein VgrG
VYRATSARYGSLVIRDRDFRRPSLEVNSTASSTAGSKSAIEVYEFMPGQSLAVGAKSASAPIADADGSVRADPRALQAFAQRRIDGHRASHRRITFTTNVLDLAPGVVTAISGHPRGDLGADRNLLVVSTVLEGQEQAGFRALVQAVLAEAPFRPPQSTSKPAALGLMTATVVGPAGEEIYTDEFGRVRVQFPWDRDGKLDQHSSCWIRVSQGWGGTGYGLMAIPRVGQEVLVGCLAGDPDQPVVVGRLYNATQQVPYPLPAQKAVSGWKTNSTPGSSGYNELRFDDRASQELLYVQAQRDLQKLVKHDEREQTTGNRSISVGGT